MNKKLLVALAVSAVMILTGLALGQAGLDPDGRPNLKAGEGIGYMIWRDQKNVWHIRWTTGGKRRLFSGTVTPLGGSFVGAKKIGFENREDSANLSPQEIRFLAHAAGGGDGIDFGLDGRVQRVRFDLRIDGKALPDRVFVGRNKLHPMTNPFDVPR